MTGGVPLTPALPKSDSPRLQTPDSSLAVVTCQEDDEGRLVTSSPPMLSAVSSRYSMGGNY